jgi:hypothetical protein
VHGTFPGTQLVEQRFQRVRETRDVAEAERGAATLDGVRDSEDGVDEFLVHLAGGELEQRGLHGVQRFEALLEEGGVELGEIERHAPPGE